MRRTDMIQVSMNEKIGPENSEAMKEMMGINGTQWGVFEVSDGMEDAFKSDLVSVHDEKEDAVGKADELNKTHGFAEYPDYDPDHVAADHNLYYKISALAVKGIYGQTQARIEYKEVTIKPTAIEAAKHAVEMGKSHIEHALIVIGKNWNANPLEVLPKPGEVRSDDKGLKLTEDQEKSLRRVAAEFGLGGEKNVESRADYEIKEGGKAWKVEAETNLGEDAKTTFFAGFKRRKLGEDELKYLQDKFKIKDPSKLPDNEYDMVTFIAKQQEGFKELEEPEVLPFGYDMHNNYQLIEQSTGQMIKIGSVGKRDIVILRVDWLDKNDGTDDYDKPGNVELMGVVADMLTAQDDSESSIGLVTSSTYASRAIETKIAGISRNRVFSVGMYGRQELAKVKGEPEAKPTDINQIPGELYKISEKLQELEKAINKNN